MILGVLRREARPCLSVQWAVPLVGKEKGKR
jgi:hypothetical protein